jgi:LacI family transcriptional regulator
LDIAVPEQVAVIGVDNDERLCQLCTPPLSSVVPDSRGAGYQAAELLDRMMRGERIRAQATLLSPLGIAERQSTDVYAVDDADLATALRYIREHACEGITVSDVLRVVPLSRRMLEHRFQRVIHRSPHSEIVRIRMERAARLLRETDLPLSEIASRAGFTSSIYLSKAFKHHTGVSPREFRINGHIA